MGNRVSDGQHTDNQPDPQSRENLQSANHLQNLPKIFSQHYNHVMGITEATRAQQKLIDGLSSIPKAAGHEAFSFTVLENGMDILKNLQSARYRQSALLYESVMELYHNVQGIYEEYGLKQFAVESPYVHEYHPQSGDNSNQRQEVSELTAGTLKILEQKELQQQETIRKLKQKLSDHSERTSQAETYCKIKDLETRKLKENIDKLTAVQKQQVGDIKRLIKENEELQQHIIELQPRKVAATVQLLHSHSGNTIKDIEAELKTTLKHHLNSVDFIKCNQLKDVDPSKMLIVLSIIASRVGTDAANAIKGIENPVNTALVLFHIKESHALSKQASTSVLTDQTFKALGGIFDMAFVNGKGIYQCEMNDIAMDGVCTFVKQNMSNKSL